MFLSTKLRGLIRDFEISRLFWNRLKWSVMSRMGCPGRVTSHFPAGEDSLEGCHFLFAAGTNGGGFGGGWFFRVKDQRDAGVEGEAFALEFGGGVAVAVAADGAQADGQDMAQVAGNKLHA
jgi:hypothetical protein